MAGKPPHEPTEETRALVRDRAAVGVPYKMIAAELGIHHTTLLKHYHEVDLLSSKAKMIRKVAGRLFQCAMGDDKKGIPPDKILLMFIMKTQAGWTEKAGLEVTGKDGKPIQMETSAPEAGPDYEKMSLEQLLELEALEQRREQIIARSADGNSRTETPSS